jgi:3-dehydrosphinganine reductase
VVRAILPAWVEAARAGNKEPGTIMFVASALALTGYVGYSAYVPSKFALRGLAESLRNELLPYNIKICIAYPVRRWVVIVVRISVLIRF